MAEQGSYSRVESAKGRETPESLPVLIERLKDQITELMDAHANLLKREVKEHVSDYVLDAALIGLGGVAAVVGFTLLHVRQSRSVGVIYLVAGGLTALLMKDRLLFRNPMPEKSIDELKKDLELLKVEYRNLTTG